MLNLKIEVREALIEIPNVQVSFLYPKNWGQLPAISYYELTNLEFSNADDQEILSEIEFQIDVWAEGSTSDLAVQINEIMQGMGFSRRFAQDLRDPSGLNRKTMRFRIIKEVPRKDA